MDACHRDIDWPSISRENGSAHETITEVTAMTAPNRTRKRIKMVLPIRVWGTDASGKPFVSLAHTLDVTPGGARIGGFTTPVTQGERIGITRGMKKAHFRVCWIGVEGTPNANQIGVQLLEVEKDIWGLRLPEAEPDEYGASQNRKASAAAAAAQAGPETQLNLAEAAEQLRATTSQLQQVEEATAGLPVPPALLEEFHRAISHARNTSSAVEQALTSSSQPLESSSANQFVSTERVKLAVSVCSAIAGDFKSVRGAVSRSSLAQLLHHVGELFAHLANFELEVDEEGENIAGDQEGVREEVTPESAAPKATTEDSSNETDETASAAIDLELTSRS